MFFLLLFADVFSSTMWSDLRAAVPQGSSALQSLASFLPDVALASRAPSTSCKYFSFYNRWRSWAREHGLTVFPASPFHFAIYLRHLMTEAKTASPLESAVHSIAWFHQLGGQPSPSDHPLVKSTLAGAQRLLAHQTTKKEPITGSWLPPRRTQWPLCITFVRLLFAYQLLLPFSDLMSLLSLFDPILRSKMTC